MREVFETNMSIGNALEGQEHSSTSRSTTSADSFGRSLRRKPQPCLVLSHNDVGSSILLVATFGGLSPTATNPVLFPHLLREEVADILIPIHSTEAISTQRPVILNKKWWNMRSVLDTPYKTNHFLILKTVKIDYGTCYVCTGRQC